MTARLRGATDRSGRSQWSCNRRRSDLEGEARRLFAKNFTVEELDKITEFFGSDLGKKYLENTPILARELSKAARVWGQGINRDLTDNVTKRMLAEGN